MSDPIHAEAVRMADALLYGAEIMARMMPPSQRPDLPTRLGLEAACALCLRGELFHRTDTDTGDDNEH